MISIIIFLILISSLFPFFIVENCVSVYASTIYYARIMTNNAYLYKSPLDIDDYSNVYFILPQTYFVELLDLSNSDFYKVNYSTFTGYVKKDCVQAIVGAPQNAYLDNLNFRIYAEMSRDLRSEPTTLSGSSSQVAYIPLYNRNLTYYGSIVGEECIDGRTNIWYYCKYSADKDYYGYVYSDFCDELPDPLPKNSEEVVYTTAPDFGETETPNALPIDNSATAIIIAILCVPALIFIFLILKGTKIIKNEKLSTGEIQDYNPLSH